MENLIIYYLEYPSKDGTKIFHKTHTNKLGAIDYRLFSGHQVRDRLLTVDTDLYSLVSLDR